MSRRLKKLVEQDEADIDLGWLNKVELADNRLKNEVRGWSVGRSVASSPEISVQRSDGARKIKASLPLKGTQELMESRSPNAFRPKPILCLILRTFLATDDTTGR